VTDPLIHAEEVDALITQFGDPRRQLCTMNVSHATFDRWARKTSTGPVACRGEVIMAIMRPNGRVLLHTKHFYPEGVYRLLSGRVLWRDHVDRTLNREVREETSLDVTVERFLGLIEYEFLWQDRTLPFVSYVFQLRELGGELCCLDQGEGITDFREVTVAELSDVAKQLEGLQPEWQDWGYFRAVAHYMVQDLLRG
jgi:ADP-ribose pyrophosphatase YjhB (NUDIX family)